MKLHYFLGLISQNYSFKVAICLFNFDNFRKHLIVGHFLVLFYEINYAQLFQSFLSPITDIATYRLNLPRGQFI